MDYSHLLKSKIPLTKESWAEIKIALWYGNLKWNDLSVPLKFAFQNFGKSTKSDRIKNQIDEVSVKKES